MVNNINKDHHYLQHYQHFQHQNIYYYSLEKKMDKYPRDLLGGFAIRGGGDDDVRDDRLNVNVNVSSKQQRDGDDDDDDDDDEEEVELNLGLSLGGRFGVDKNAKKKKLMRSSSVVGTMPLFRDEEAVAPSPAVFPALMRTSSLPTETEEEWRRRKEIQTLRRLEAKRRRSEKMRGSREVAGAGDEVAAAAPAPAKQVLLGDVLGKGKGFQGLFGQPCSQGSVDSQGGSSSSVSEMDSKVFLGSGSCGEAKSPASNQSTQERSSHDVVGSGAKANENVARTSKAEVENPPKKPNPAKNLMGREIGSNAMGDMPCVFTKGDGPNGRRIEGILYKYGKGQEVRIMCVCHGNFLSPAEFVKHAGGGDVAHPLRHIVVNPSSSPFL